MVLKFIKKYWGCSFHDSYRLRNGIVAGLGWFLAAVSSVAFIQSNDNPMDIIELAEDQN